MGDVPLGLAVAAGMVAALNPCGFALLPAYLSVLVIGDDQPSRGAALIRALTATAALTAGFVAVFALFGFALAPFADAMQRHLPWFTVVFGLLLAGVGVWLLAGRELPGVVRWVGRGPAVRRSLTSMTVFGAAYALASLGCTIGPFLAIVVSSLRAGSVIAGVGLFVAYAAGMGLVVGVASVALATARTALIGRLRRLTPALSYVGGAIVLLAGAYVAYYGWYELRLRGGGDPTDPIVDAATTIQGLLADAIGRIGPFALVAVLAAILALSAILVRRARSTDRRR